MSGSTKEDDATFKQLLIDDPECKKCFECGYPYPQWCSYTHGIMMCLECSGKHRGLGTHLVTVRSSTMDGWSNWKPEKLKQMALGGNKRCRLFFEQEGIAELPIKQKYEHPKSQFYKARLEAQGLGQTFDEANFRAVDYTPKPANQQQDRFKGSGSRGGNRSPAQENEWMSSLSSGWNSVATGATSAMSSAGKSVASADLGTKVSSTASDTATSVSHGATKAWGAMALFATSIVSTVKKSVDGDDNEGDGLGALTRGIEKTNISEKDNTKYGHVEHLAEQRTLPKASSDGLGGLTAGLQRPATCRYESLGSDVPAKKATNSGEDFMSALASGPSNNSSPPPAVIPVKSTPARSSSQQSSPTSAPAPSSRSPAQPKPSTTSANEDDEWNADW